MSSSDLAISVRGLSKRYAIAHNVEKHVTLAETLLARAKNPLQRAEIEQFWALKDVEFDVKAGDVVGIIGRNGAGKSTLLKILSRITEPTTGEIDVYGRIGSLLEVGTGFHAELTGRENIFLNGAILGMSKSDIRRQFDAIVDFAGVEKFLDTPVKRYSSGMYVRLAFAVAAHLEPEIMIVDEVLAVGDIEFQRKCLGKMQDVASSGRTVLFVSHQMQAVSALCHTGIFMDAGRIVYNGPVAKAIELYMTAGAKRRSLDVTATRRPGSGELRFADFTTDRATYVPIDDILIDMDVEEVSVGRQPRYFISLEIINAYGLPVLHLDSRLQNIEFETLPHRRIRYTVRQPRLAHGEYRIHAFLCTAGGVVDRFESATSFTIEPILPYPASRSDVASNAIVYPDFSIEHSATPAGKLSSADAPVALACK